MISFLKYYCCFQKSSICNLKQRYALRLKTKLWIFYFELKQEKCPLKITKHWKRGFQYLYLYDFWEELDATYHRASIALFTLNHSLLCFDIFPSWPNLCPVILNKWKNTCSFSRMKPISITKFCWEVCCLKTYGDLYLMFAGHGWETMLQES